MDRLALVSARAFSATKRRFFYSMDRIKNKSLMNSALKFSKGVYIRLKDFCDRQGGLEFLRQEFTILVND